MIALAIALVSTSVSVAGTAVAPKPTAEIAARQMRPRPGSPPPRFGARILLGSEAGPRVFINDEIGFALAADDSATIPVRTTDGGRTWTVDGPQLHVDAADGPEAVDAVGIVSPSEEFAYGSSVVDVTTNGGRTWWEAFLGENVTAVVPGAHGLVALVQQSVSNSQLNPIVTWQYVSNDGGRHWHDSTSFAVVG